MDEGEILVELLQSELRVNRAASPCSVNVTQT